MPAPTSTHPPPITIPSRSLTNGPSSAKQLQSASTPTRKHSPDDMNGKPTKRARRAINCAPCRASKLKCDRARPCSGCVLRGTTNACYTTEDGEGSRSEDYRNDPHNGIAQIRHGLAIIESYMNRGGPVPPMSAVSPRPSLVSFKRELDSSDPLDAGLNMNMRSQEPSDVVQMMPDPEKGGLYVGPTSASALLSFRNDRKSGDEDMEQADPNMGDVCTLDPLSNLDLLSTLPEVLTADALIHFFFENSTWVYQYLPPGSFLPAWDRFKSSTCTDHVLLATIFIVLAIAVHYVPPDHPLLGSFNLPLGAPPAGLAAQYYTASNSAMARHRAAPGAAPSIELIEYLLLRSQYLSISKDDCEEIWHIRGELLSAATALGLHRDPGRWRLAADTVERRRWAWWNIIALERWTAFLVGRPLAIANHHFDTLLPDGSDPSGPAPQNAGPFAAHCQYFRLALVLGEITDDALRVRGSGGVPYDRACAHDRALSRWFDALPPECRLDVFPLARALTSPRIEQRRAAVQSLHLTSAMYHIQFTLHRPFTVPTSSRALGGDQARSVETAVFAADKLITFVVNTLDEADRESKASNQVQHPSPLTVPGHLGWGPYHIFHAAVFYSFQLIWRPDQSGTALLRADIRRVVGAFERLRPQLRIAGKALNILRALAPLYEEVCVDTVEGECERRRDDQLAFVRRLAFPWQHHTPAGSASPLPRHTSSPASMAYTPTHNVQQLPQAATTYSAPPASNGAPPMPYGMQTGEEGLWSASLGLDSSEWNRFLKDMPTANGAVNGVLMS